MAIPKLIAVSLKGGNYSAYMGFYDPDGECNQFWAQTAATLTKPEPPPAHPLTCKRWYAILHKFDQWGKHLGTEHWFAGTTADGEPAVIQRARAKRGEMIASLGVVEFADIEIALFQVEIDGQVFGLVDVSEPEAGERWAARVEMKPAGLLFTPPWSGTYST